MKHNTRRSPVSPLSGRRALPLPSARPAGAVRPPGALREMANPSPTPRLALAPAGAVTMGAEGVEGVTVRVVPVPPTGTRLYAQDGRGRTLDLTGTGIISARGDALLLTVPAWATELAAEGREGVARTALPSSVRPAGLPGDLVTLEITGTGSESLRITQNGVNITSTPRPDGTPARTGRNGITLGATEGVPVRVRVGSFAEREFDVVAENGTARIDATLRRVRWPNFTPYAVIRLPNGVDATTQALPDGTGARWEGRDWISGLPGNVSVLAVERPDGTRAALTVPPIVEGEREVVIRETPLALFGTAPAPLPTRPTRPGLLLMGGPTTLGGLGGGGSSSGGGSDGGGSAPPGLVNVRLRGATRGASGRPAERVLVDGNDGTAASLADGNAARWDGADWIFGLASTVRTVRVVRADGSMVDLPVPAGSGEVLVQLPAPPAPVPLTLRLRALPPGSRVFVGEIDATTSPVSVPPGGWSGNVWSIGVPRGTRAVTIRYPDATTRELAVPAVAASVNEVTVDVPAPAAPEALPANLTLRVRNARATDSVARPSFLLFVGDADATDWSQPSGARAGWDGNDWLVGLPRATRTVRVRYPSGSFGTFTLALPEAGTREWTIEPPSNLLAVVAEGPEGFAPVDSLAFARIRMVDPPAGTYAVARGLPAPVSPDRTEAVPLEERRLEGVTTQMRLGAPPPNPDGTLAANYGAIPPVWVTEARLPDAPGSTWQTMGADVVLPSGERLPVALSPVPTDGVFVVDLSRYPGARPTAHGSDAAGAASDGGIGLGTLALGAAALGAAVWGARRYAARGGATRSNPSPAPTHRARRRRAHR